MDIDYKDQCEKENRECNLFESKNTVASLPLLEALVAMGLERAPL